MLNTLTFQLLEYMWQGNDTFETTNRNILKHVGIEQINTKIKVEVKAKVNRVSHLDQ